MAEAEGVETLEEVVYGAHCRYKRGYKEANYHRKAVYEQLVIVEEAHHHQKTGSLSQ